MYYRSDNSSSYILLAVVILMVVSFFLPNFYIQVIINLLFGYLFISQAVYIGNGVIRFFYAGIGVLSLLTVVFMFTGNIYEITQMNNLSTIFILIYLVLSLIPSNE